MKDELDGKIVDGGTLVRRLEIREKSRLQGLFLEHLHRTPLGGTLVFRSANALNGVYTHLRWSEDLDFHAPPDISMNFAEIAREQGIPLVDRPGMTPVYARPGLLCPRVEIGIDVNDLNESVLEPEIRPFVTVTGEHIPVRVQPVAEIMAYKLWCLVRRHEMIDFVDLWGASWQYPAEVAKIADVFARKRRNRPNAPPMAALDIAAVLSGLDGMADAWETSLRGVMLHPPPWAEVRRDIARLLPAYAGMQFYEQSLSFLRRLAAESS
jgi:hypothetical protein